jgi:hypothetical protein
MERTYALMRLKAGDYLLPANDGATIWRISQYDEDGSAGVVGRRWMTSRYTGPSATWVTRENIDDANRWECWTYLHRTRSEAIDSALSAQVASR